MPAPLPPELPHGQDDDPPDLDALLTAVAWFLIDFLEDLADLEALLLRADALRNVVAEVRERRAAS